MLLAEPLFQVAAADTALTTDEWYTPRWLFKAADLTFDLDVCAPVDPAFRSCPARRYLTALDDGLATPWDGMVWMNPPYSAPGPWVERWAAHENGLALVAAASSPWRRRLMTQADAITLITIDGNAMRAGRGFGRPDGSSASYPFALILAARGEQCMSALPRVAAVDPYAGGAWFRKPD